MNEDTLIRAGRELGNKAGDRYWYRLVLDLKNRLYRWKRKILRRQWAGRNGQRGSR